MNNQPSSFITALRGVSFRPIEAKVIVKGLSVDDELDLERDPHNEYDPNAIKVLDPASGEFIGFLAKEDAADIAPWMDDGWCFTCAVEERISTYALQLRVEPSEHLPATA